MALDADQLIDRRRLARRLAFWRGLAVIVIAAAVAVLVARVAVPGGAHIARVEVQGAIVGVRPLTQLLEKLEERSDVAAILLAIDSPGGTSTGGEALYKALREIDASTPVVAHINTLGASAAYMTAIASDHIVAQRTSLTGSVGVLIQYARVNELLGELGVEVNKLESGPLKAEPNPFGPASPEAVAVLQSVVDDTFDWFLNLVNERRDLSAEDREAIATGRIFTGAQALEMDLIDAIGGEDEAVDWLEQERDVPADLPVRTYKARSNVEVPLVARLASSATRAVLGALGITVRPVPPSGSVDGLWSLWHVNQ